MTFFRLAASWSCPLPTLPHGPLASKLSWTYPSLTRPKAAAEARPPAGIPTELSESDREVSHGQHTGNR